MKGGDIIEDTSMGVPERDVNERAFLLYEKEYNVAVEIVKMLAKETKDYKELNHKELNLCVIRRLCEIITGN